jgi:hypothetical protein
MWAGANHRHVCTGRAPKTHERIEASYRPRGLASRSCHNCSGCMHTACPQPCKRKKVRGRNAPSARPRERIAERNEAQKSNHCHPRSSRLFTLFLAAGQPDENQSGWMSMANGTWVRRSGNAQPSFCGSKPARDCLETLRAPPDAQAKTAHPARPRWPELADSGTPRGERTAVHDRSRAADAFLAQSDMVGEPSPGYHDEPLAGLMTPPRIQRPRLS